MKFNLRLLLCVIFLSHFSISQAQTSVFKYGVASGDATSEFVILWTHISDVIDSSTVICEVALDSSFKNIVFIDSVLTYKERDFTVKLDAGPLIENAKYFYRFLHQKDTSIIGITYTLPTILVDNFKIGFASCANFEAGYFNAYKALAEIADLKALVHLGDYIYEYASGEYALNKKITRRYIPKHELITLSDYRNRYKQYRSDVDLMTLHAKLPFFCIWDDHEFADDAHSAGAGNHSINTEGNWIDRSEAARKSYFEWMPIRENEFGNIYRKVSIGKLISLFFLDTRMDDRKEGGQMMSPKQQKWYYNALGTDSSVWKLTIQQVMMAPLTCLGIPINPDQWDGFGKERLKLFEFIKNKNIENYVVLSGDFHSSWASELKLKETIIGREIVCPGITSPGLNLPFIKHLLPLTNPHIRFSDLTNKGFVTLDINANCITSKWHFLETVDYSSSKIKFVHTLFLPVKQLVFKQNVPVNAAIVEAD